MQDTELYMRLLSLGQGWRVREVTLDMDANRVDVWVETTEGGTWCCPECEAAGSIYDHTGEQAWRHLDTCQCRTYADGLWLSQSQPLQAGHLLPLRRSRPLSGSSDIMTTTCRGYPHETRKDQLT